MTEDTQYAQWEDKFVIGEPSIDKDHQEMFNVINRVHKMVVIGGNIKWTVSEAIKFFKAYTIRHFENEEAFMRAVQYSRYEEHKRIHDGMRNIIIPRLYSQLESTDYSPESVEQFLRVCQKWLSKHIIGHDRDLVQWTHLRENQK